MSDKYVDRLFDVFWISIGLRLMRCIDKSFLSDHLFRPDPFATWHVHFHEKDWYWNYLILQIFDFSNKVFQSITTHRKDISRGDITDAI